MATHSSPVKPEKSRESRPRAAVVIVVAAAITAMTAVLALTGCARSVSYSARVTYSDPHHSASTLRGGVMAVLPLLTREGPFAGEGSLEPGRVFGQVLALRPDLTFVTHEEFENAFPPRFDRRKLAEFYHRAFREESLAAGSLDSMWQHVRQPYILIFSVRDGAQISNMDRSAFKHATVVCEIVSRDGRKVVWRAASKGVSDDRRVAGSEIVLRCIRRLAEEIPAIAPDYGRENW